MTIAIRALTILASIVVVFLTLGPIGIRALSPVPAEFDRMLAYAVLGALATLSAPRRPWLGALLVVGMILGLELAQRFTADRHGQLLDAAEKLIGAAVGIAIGGAIRKIVRPRSAPAG